MPDSGQRTRHVVEPRRRKAVSHSNSPLHGDEDVVNIVPELDANRPVAATAHSTRRSSRGPRRIIGFRRLGSTIVRSPACWAVTGLVMIAVMVAVVFQLEPPELKHAAARKSQADQHSSAGIRCVHFHTMRRVVRLEPCI